MDLIFENKFVDLSSQTCYNLGKLFYFCITNSGEKFTNIHPYFFFMMSKESDHINLLKKFKANKFEIYKTQYIEYKMDKSKLINLELGLETHCDYIKYIFVSDLKEETIKLYDEFIKGFHFFSSRNKYSQLIKNLPIIYYINTILTPSYFSMEIIFSVADKIINTDQFVVFCDIFNDKFNKLTTKELTCFVQNITGCQYYNKTIEVIYAHNELSSLMSSEQSEYNSVNSSTKLLYEISTCNAQLIIHIRPTEKNIEEIINCLIIEDLNLKN